MPANASRTAAVALSVFALCLSPFLVLTPIATPGAGAQSVKANKVADWFKRYDQIRHEAQMSDAERDRSRSLMMEGLMANFSGSTQSSAEKEAGSALLRKMVDRYRKASSQMAALPKVSETKKLSDGYAQYFRNAGGLFADYLKMQSDLFAKDSSGNTLLSGMAGRKAALESLDAANKELDGKLRAKYGIPPYAWAVPVS
jgi:hypothetical protein